MDLRLAHFSLWALSLWAAHSFVAAFIVGKEPAV
jgi:hypothetical protein